MLRVLVTLDEISNQELVLDLADLLVERVPTGVPSAGCALLGAYARKLVRSTALRRAFTTIAALFGSAAAALHRTGGIAAWPGGLGNEWSNALRRPIACSRH